MCTHDMAAISAATEIGDDSAPSEYQIHLRPLAPEDDSQANPDTQ